VKFAFNRKGALDCNSRDATRSAIYRTTAIKFVVNRTFDCNSRNVAIS